MHHPRKILKSFNKRHSHKCPLANTLDSMCRYLTRDAQNHKAMCGSRTCVFSKYNGISGMGCRWIGNVEDLQAHGCSMHSQEMAGKIMKLIDQAPIYYFSHLKLL
jgi:hypothetical protein